MVTQIVGTIASKAHFFPPNTSAARLGPPARKELSLRVLGRTESVTGLAQNHGISRKFLYQQAAKASDALDDVFAPTTGDDEILLPLGGEQSQVYVRDLGLQVLGIAHVPVAFDHQFPLRAFYAACSGLSESCQRSLLRWCIRFNSAWCFCGFRWKYTTHSFIHSKSSIRYNTP